MVRGFSGREGEEGAGGRALSKIPDLRLIAAKPFRSVPAVPAVPPLFSSPPRLGGCDGPRCSAHRGNIHQLLLLSSSAPRIHLNNQDKKASSGPETLHPSSATDEIAITRRWDRFSSSGGTGTCGRLFFRPTSCLSTLRSCTAHGSAIVYCSCVLWACSIAETQSLQVSGLHAWLCF